MLARCVQENAHVAAVGKYSAAVESPMQDFCSVVSLYSARLKGIYIYIASEL